MMSFTIFTASVRKILDQPSYIDMINYLFKVQCEKKYVSNASIVINSSIILVEYNFII